MILLSIGLGGCIGHLSAYDKGRAIQSVVPAANSPLKVLPLFSVSPSSTFPISEYNLITTAHAIPADMTLAVVDGRPVFAFPDSKYNGSDVPLEDDWRVLCSTISRFTPNIIDTTVSLTPGTNVYVAGFPGTRKPPFDGVAFANEVPIVVQGSIIGANPEHPALLDVRVSKGDYHGISGGPAAIIDSNGDFRVWGMAVGGRLGYRSSVFETSSADILTIIRLDPSTVRRFKNLRMNSSQPSTKQIPRARNVE